MERLCPTEIRNQNRRKEDPSRREVSGSAAEKGLHFPQVRGAGRGAGVGDITGQALPGNTKQNRRTLLWAQAQNPALHALRGRPASLPWLGTLRSSQFRSEHRVFQGPTSLLFLPPLLGPPGGPAASARPRGQDSGELTICAPGPPPFGYVDPRLRSIFQFHAGSWESWCCCCLIPADRPWDLGGRWRLEMADTRSVHETRFEAAVKVIQSLPKNGSFQPTNEMMLKFYSFYKQATEGPCKLSRPGFWDPIGRYKWDAWSSLGDMTKEEAMIAYVEEMKKILETMPMTEKVEELLHVIGPFYEIVEDKTSVTKWSFSVLDLGNVLTSTPNAKTVNGKAESSDSGAESEEEETQEEVKGAEQNDNDKMLKKSTDHKNLEIVVTNGYDKDSFVQDVQNDIQVTPLNDRSAEEVKSVDQNVEQTRKTDYTQQDLSDDYLEDVSGIQHLTSDSDSEVYCDSMEQFGQEEPLDSFTSSNGPFRYYMGGTPNEPLESPVFSGNVQASSESGNFGDKHMIAVEGKGEVKHGGEDGRNNSGAPHREKRGGENEEFSNVRRGKGICYFFLILTDYLYKLINEMWSLR
ncbi:Acyl-CoA-binding domain-containing protein 5 [Galemys pyrenaicus]|uniref:Acyl-CoA-binding domain-containing protein 5 n=1 Tax=Galemys pyrenaicus TaxID=202257 RepID=A0A8J6DFU4_GALPY|nr:Acyl-CoA-binding domain-containing protein 5 [Galemys pyrenaicus]